jgi:hypothetical protein
LKLVLLWDRGGLVVKLGLVVMTAFLGACVAPKYNSDRMVEDYARKIY